MSTHGAGTKTAARTRAPTAAQRMKEYNARQDERFGLKPGTSATLARHGFFIGRADEVGIAFEGKGQLVAMREDGLSFRGANLHTNDNNGAGGDMRIGSAQDMEQLAAALSARGGRAAVLAETDDQLRALIAEREARGNNQYMTVGPNGEPRAANYDELGARTRATGTRSGGGTRAGGTRTSGTRGAKTAGAQPAATRENATTAPARPPSAAERKRQATAGATRVAALDRDFTARVRDTRGDAMAPHNARVAREEAITELRPTILSLTPAARRSVLNAAGISESDARKWGLLPEGETLAKPARAPRAKKSA